ncbi:hypothetical protein ACFL1U_01255 [Patescibacteria group bacterium]
MLHKAKQIIGLPIKVRDEEDIEGTVEKIIIDPKQRRLHALLFKRARLLKAAKFVLFDAVISIDDQAAQIGTAAQVMNLKEDDYTQKIYQEGVVVLGQKVVTEANRYLGDVINYHFDLNTGQITDLIVLIKGLPGRGDNEERQISIDEVLAFYKEALIVKDPEARSRLKILNTAKEKILLETSAQEVQQRKLN